MGSVDLIRSPLGPSTKKALEAYQNGVSPEVTGKAGFTNGAAMRIAPVGVIAGLQNLSLDETANLVAVACWPTHATSPAIAGATSAAWAIATAINGSQWSDVVPAAIDGAIAGVARGRWVYSSDIAKRIGLACRMAGEMKTDEELAVMLSDIIGTGEPTTETIPTAIAIAEYCKGDPAKTIEIAGNLRGDTDTIAAIAGAICGAHAGISAFPKEWLDVVSTANNLDIQDWTTRLTACAQKPIEHDSMSAMAQHRMVV